MMERNNGYSKVVSVIIPAYNCSRYIETAIESAINQPETLEVLVIDDGSSDGLDAVMDKYQEEPKVRYLKNKENMGVAATRNRGVREACGTYVAFLDADDYWEKNKLTMQMEALERTGGILCGTGRRLFRDDSDYSHVIGVPETISYKMLLRGNCINCSSVLAKRSVMLEFPMEQDDCHEDYLTWLKILKKYGNACGVNKPLLAYRVHEGSKSGTKLKSAAMTFKVYRYMGMNLFLSIYYFCCYAIAGVKKYNG